MSMASIQLRQLGQNGPKIPALGFGLMSMCGAYGTPPSDEEQFKILDRAVEIGAAFWDTSDEEMLGKWFKRTGKRDQIVLASKFGLIGAGEINRSGEYCKKACEASLKKLGVDSIDLYCAHRVNFSTPIEETMRALATLKTEGKIKHIGLSEVSSTTLRRAHKIAPVAAVQMKYSPFALDIERESGTNLLDTCRELGVAVVCYSPLGRGLLTGAFTTKESVSGEGDMRGVHFPRVSEENLEGNAKLVGHFKMLAEKKGCTASQLAIAWLLKQGEDIIPIPGTKKIKYLEENWGSIDIQLIDEEEAQIRKFAEGVELLGYRSTPAGKVHAFVDTKEEA